jgi:hypothetical protein
MPVILATWDAEMGGGGWLLEAGPGKKLMRPHHNQQLFMVACTCHLRDDRKYKIRGLHPGLSGQKLRLYLQNRAKGTGGMAQVVACLPSKYKVLNSVPPPVPAKKNSQWDFLNFLFAHSNLYTSVIT